MDKNVIAAMAKWPGVPDVYGWLSLSEKGQWRLHPQADAWEPGGVCRTPFSKGESIDNEQLRDFIGRNYAADDQGRWYFQNGPQRVHIRLDAAPYVLHADSAAPTLCTHNGLAVTRILGWWLDDAGRLYATSEHGPGLIAGRDAAFIFEALQTDNGTPLLEALERTPPFLAGNLSDTMARPQQRALRIEFRRGQTNDSHSYGSAPLNFCKAEEAATAMGFVQCPQP